MLTSLEQVIHRSQQCVEKALEALMLEKGRRPPRTHDLVELSGIIPIEVESMQNPNRLLERITVESGKCGGRPCIRGKRIRVSDILELLASGATEQEILQDYQFLEADDIHAALAFAAAQSRHILMQLG